MGAKLLVTANIDSPLLGDLLFTWTGSHEHPIRVSRRASAVKDGWPLHSQWVQTNQMDPPPIGTWRNTLLGFERACEEWALAEEEAESG